MSLHWLVLTGLAMADEPAVQNRASVGVLAEAGPHAGAPVGQTLLSEWLRARIAGGEALELELRAAGRGGLRLAHEAISGDRIRVRELVRAAARVWER